MFCSDWYIARFPCSCSSLIPCLRVAETIIDKSIELKAIGGVYGNQKPTEFLCLLLKLLQLQPEKEILLEYLQADEFKYVSITLHYPPPSIDMVPSGISGRLPCSTYG